MKYFKEVAINFPLRAHREVVAAVPTRISTIKSGKLDNKLIASLLFKARCYRCEIVSHFSILVKLVYAKRNSRGAGL